MAKRHVLYSVHFIYTLHQQQKVGLLLTIIYCWAVRVNARYNLYNTINLTDQSLRAFNVMCVKVQAYNQSCMKIPGMRALQNHSTGTSR